MKPLLSVALALASLVDCSTVHCATVDASASACDRPAAFAVDTAAERHARLLAGMDDGAGDAALAAHAAQLDRSFARLEGVQMRRVRAWSASVLPPEVHAADTLYYPFSGPDVLYPTALFPQATRMLYTGLEPVGAAPAESDFEATGLANGLAQVRRSLATLLGQSFFVTAQMQQQFARNRFAGVTPILMLLLARSGYQVDQVVGVYLATDGRLCARDFTERVDNAGVEVRYHKSGEQQLRTLVYLRVDLSNDGLAAAPGYARYVRQAYVAASYLKSASYLMHTREFSAIRQLLLEVSPALLEDDSGVPLREFSPEHWQWTFYGRYQSAASGFGGHTQPDLRQAFVDAAPAALPFWIGYRHSPADSNLQLYQRRVGDGAVGARSDSR
ncbi:MAG: hypothetical protein IPO66_05745 [Rhodanobacteraceae bacterium]|nr:hypothetical protein [Rhodanobacteraceae bacterium]